MVIDEKIEKSLLDLGLISDYSDKISKYYRLPTMDFHFVWLYNESGECDTPTDLCLVGDRIVTTISTRYFSTVYDAIPFIKSLIKKYKVLMIEIKRRELEQDFKNE